MTDSNKIFTDRKKINQILQHLKDDNFSDEKLEKSLLELENVDHKQLISILIKELDGESQDFFIASFLLKEIDDDLVTDLLLDKVFNSKLDDEKKIILFSILDEKGIDLSHFDLENVFDDIEGFGDLAINNIIQEIEDDNVPLEKIIEIIYEIPDEAKNKFIDNLLNTFDCSQIKQELLKIILITEDISNIKKILNRLSSLNSECVFEIIEESYQYIYDDNLKPLFERAIRKLSFKGVVYKKSKPKQKKSNIYKIIISSIDGAGSQSVWFAIKSGRKINCIFLLLNEKSGIKDCFWNEFTIKQFNKFVKDKLEDISIFEVKYDFAIQLINEALFINPRPYPVFNYIRMKYFKKEEIYPNDNPLKFDNYDLESIIKDTSLTNESDSILDFLECESWFVESENINNLANKLLKNKNTSLKIPLKYKKQVLKEELLVMVPFLKRRLLLTAKLIENDFDLESEEKNSFLNLFLNTALTIEKKPLNHPFLLSIAEISLVQAHFNNDYS